MTLVNVEKVKKHYPIGGVRFTALNNINLQVKRGEFCGIIGPSGSGLSLIHI